MQLHQAENLALLILHMEKNVTRNLHMDVFVTACGTPACAMGECATIPHFQKLGFAIEQDSFEGYYMLYQDGWPGSMRAAGRQVFGCGELDFNRLFGSSRTNAWKNPVVSPAAWATEARNVLRDHGFILDGNNITRTNLACLIRHTGA